MDNQQNVRRHSEPGFSLIEVILAIGMLSTVMISISSMFILGGRQMQSGKKMTEATVIAQDIMENFEEQSYTVLYIGLGAADTDTTVTVASTTGGSALEPWQAKIDEKLNAGSASVTVIAMGPGTPDFGTSTGVRITVTVSWSEMTRARNVTMSTVRF